MFDLSGNQPPDWTRFSCTRQVTWHEIETAAHIFRDRILEDYDLLVAILRAGSPVAAVLAKQTGLPIDYLVCSRRQPQPHFLEGESRAPRHRRILLVDDVCGSSWTFARSGEYCRQLGNSVGTFSVFRCDKPGMFIPDFSMPANAGVYLRWPWEYQIETEMPRGTRKTDMHRLHC